MVLRKIHKEVAQVAPLCLIVSSIGSFTYSAAKVLADILGAQVGKTPHHIMNSGEFVEKISNLEVPPGQKLVFYEVSALFTSIPVPDTIVAVKEKLEEDNTIAECTPNLQRPILAIIMFLESCILSFQYIWNKPIQAKLVADNIGYLSLRIKLNVTTLYVLTGFR